MEDFEPDPHGLVIQGKKQLVGMGILGQIDVKNLMDYSHIFQIFTPTHMHLHHPYELYFVGYSHHPNI